MTKLREIVLGPSVTLPPMDTNNPERQLSFLEFLEQFVLTADGLKTNDNLDKLFALEEAIEKVKAEAIAKSGSKLPTNIQLPQDPGANASDDAKQKYAVEVQAVVESVNKLNREHWAAVYEASVGMSFTVPDDVFQSACTAVKAKLDDLARPSPMNGGRPAIDPFIERRVLRHYHRFAQSKEVG